MGHPTNERQEVLHAYAEVLVLSGKDLRRRAGIHAEKTVDIPIDVLEGECYSLVRSLLSSKFREAPGHPHDPCVSHSPRRGTKELPVW
jgi:hypothetical protein